MYEAIDWSVIVLGALIPVTAALQSTGSTELIASMIAAAGQTWPPAASIALVLVATMLVTPLLNNAATVLLMGPIAAGLAIKLGYSVDPFLMAVAIGASCDFLTLRPSIEYAGDGSGRLSVRRLCPARWAAR